MKKTIYDENYDIQLKFRNDLIKTNEKNSIRLELYLFIVNIIGLFIGFITNNKIGLLFIITSISSSLVSQFISYLAFSEQVKITDNLINNLKIKDYKVKKNKYNKFIDPLTLISLFCNIIGLCIIFFK
jgi:hypothetical protein